MSTDPWWSVEGDGSGSRSVAVVEDAPLSGRWTDATPGPIGVPLQMFSKPLDGQHNLRHRGAGSPYLIRLVNRVTARQDGTQPFRDAVSSRAAPGRHDEFVESGPAHRRVLTAGACRGSGGIQCTTSCRQAGRRHPRDWLFLTSRGDQTGPAGQASCRNRGATAKGVCSQTFDEWTRGPTRLLMRSWWKSESIACHFPTDPPVLAFAKLAAQNNNTLKKSPIISTKTRRKRLLIAARHPKKTG
jgi:hypothetical protein